MFEYLSVRLDLPKQGEPARALLESQRTQIGNFQKFSGKQRAAFVQGELGPEDGPRQQRFIRKQRSQGRQGGETISSRDLLRERRLRLARSLVGDQAPK